MRFARFDADRVFNEYHKTKKLREEISIKRHDMGPDSANTEVRRRLELSRRVQELSERLKNNAKNTPSATELEQDLRIASLELELYELKVGREATHKADLAIQDMQRAQAKILGEITVEVKKLAAAHGYAFVIPEKGSGPDLPVIVVGVELADITDELIAKLNGNSPPK